MAISESVAEVCRNMTQRSRRRTLPARILVYAVAAALAFALAAGVGATVALMR
jgi:hypothetical protein